MSEMIGGQPDLLPSGKNSKPDEILGVFNAIYVPEGKKPSRWTNTDEFTKFAETYARSDSCFGLGDPSGLALEIPFGDDTALVTLRWPIKTNLCLKSARINLAAAELYCLKQGVWSCVLCS
jgi:hypothetical protein